MKKILGYRFPDDDFGEDVVAHAVRRYNRKMKAKEKQRQARRASGRATTDDSFRPASKGATSDAEEVRSEKYWSDYVLDVEYASADDTSIDGNTEPKYKLAIEEYSPAVSSDDEMEYYYGAKDLTTGTSPVKLEDSQGHHWPERDGASPSPSPAPSDKQLQSRPSGILKQTGNPRGSMSNVEFGDGRSERESVEISDDI